jgi:protein-disulfide isomerase
MPAIFTTGTATAAATAKGGSDKAPAQEKLKAPTQELDEANLRKNIHARVVKTVQDQGLPLTPAFQAFTPEQITIVKKIPFPVGDRTFYLVSLSFKAPPQIGGNIRNGENQDQVLVVAVDATGSWQYDNIYEIATNANMLLNAKREVSKTAFPADFGDILYTGTGKEDIIFISDPFCPFCRGAFEYLQTKLSKIKNLKLVHRPLPELHPLANITSLVMLYAADTFDSAELMKLVKYAYGPLYDAVPADKRENWRGSAGEQEAAEIDVVSLFLKAFPKLNKWEKVEDAYYFIKGKFARKMQDEQSFIQTLGVAGTPVIYANGYQIRGFNRPELDTIFK